MSSFYYHWSEIENYWFYAWISRYTLYIFVRGEELIICMYVPIRIMYLFENCKEYNKAWK
jgi:hypothetical protein